MIRAVVKPISDRKYVATVEDKVGNVLWGPSEPNEYVKALKLAQRQRDRFLSVGTKPRSRAVR